jgi:ATP-dependent Lon protease
LDEQEKVLDDLTQIKNYFNIEKPYLITLLDKQIPEKFKAVALNKINTLKQMSHDRSSSEYNKLKTWVDAFIKIPFEQYHSLPLTINDGIEKSNEFITNAKEQLDKCVFDLNDAKLQILQLLGQWIVNPDAIGSAIAIHGPMGTGKTSLVRDGISKILNRPFAFIPLGGATDSSFLEGHGYTYEGSTYGKIVDILIQSKTMNPIIMFDELDKVSDTPKGEEIIGILTHLTDSTQNCEYHDKYFSELSFNLSKCLFIFSYNDESKINPILKDRLYKIKTKGYDKKDKVIIAENYLIPNIRETIKLDESLLKIPKNVLEYVIEKYCNDEHGVRNLKRNLEIIFTKLNLLRLLKDDNPLLKDQIKISQKFPITLDLESLEKLINKPESSLPPFGMYT